MDITPLIPKGRQIIEAYGDNGFRISGMRYEGPLIVLPTQCLSWSIAGQEEFTESLFDPILELRKEIKIDLILLGTGAKIRPVPKLVREILHHQGLVIEPMDTGAACRTYNILLAEGRDICAALLPV